MTGDLLTPGSHRAARSTDDAAFVAAMMRVETAWMGALVSCGVAEDRHVDAVVAACAQWQPDIAGLARAAEDAGNPATSFVAALRAQVADTEAAVLLHRGLTSQDLLDTALVLVTRDALGQLAADLVAVRSTLAALASRHRDAVMPGRTLTQHAVPTTFGLKAAQWLMGVLDAVDAVDRVRADLSVQCGGAAGTLSLAADLVADPLAAVQALAAELDLIAPALPWHTRRTPVTRTGDALVAVTDALGVIAADVALLSRPEIAELSEGIVAGRGGSSTMPQKRNPVLSVLVRSAALQAPLLAAQLHLCAAQSVDERPDGAWHGEWPAYRRLLVLALTAAGQVRELLAGLQVHTRTMRARARSASADLLAERHGSAGGVPGDADPASYLGLAGDLVDAALRREQAGCAGA